MTVPGYPAAPGTNGAPAYDPSLGAPQGYAAPQYGGAPQYGAPQGGFQQPQNDVQPWKPEGELSASASGHVRSGDSYLKLAEYAGQVGQPQTGYCAVFRMRGIGVSDISGNKKENLDCDILLFDPSGQFIGEHKGQNPVNAPIVAAGKRAMQNGEGVMLGRLGWSDQKKYGNHPLILRDLDPTTGQAVANVAVQHGYLSAVPEFRDPSADQQQAGAPAPQAGAPAPAPQAAPQAAPAPQAGAPAPAPAPQATYTPPAPQG